MYLDHFKFVAYPKCGNTWIHAVIRDAYDCEWLDFDHSHNMPEFNSETYIDFNPDFSGYRGTKTIVAVRHLGDVMVSMFMSYSFRDGPNGSNYDKNRYKRINEILFDEIYGIEKYMKFYNALSVEINNNPYMFHIVKYEDLIKDQMFYFKKMFSFIDFYENKKIEYAVKNNTFNKMKERETVDANNWIGALRRSLNWESTNDSYKVRIGKIGQYGKYFTDENINLIHFKMKQLPSVFGYTDMVDIIEC